MYNRKREKYVEILFLFYNKLPILGFKLDNDIKIYKIYLDTLPSSQVPNFGDVIVKIYYGSQIPVTTWGFEHWKSYIQCSYLIHHTIWLYGLVRYVTTLKVKSSLLKKTLLWSLESVIHDKSPAGHHLDHQTI